jgi:hypothetical protein
VYIYIMKASSRLKRGRPVTGAEPKRRYQVALEPGVARKLRDFGGDNLSRGIALAAKRIKERKS